jgi:ribosome-associated toxin RatA of RatAB toxin-antitoxin module
MRIAMLFVVVVAVWTGASKAAADADAVAAQLGDGVQAGPVPGSGVEGGRAVGVVNAPFQRVLAAIRDYSSYHEFLPHFRESRVLSSRGSDAIVYLEARVIRETVTLWALMRIRALPSTGEAQVVEGRMLQGNMGHFTARWELSPLDGGHRTLVTFELLVDPELPMPDAVFTAENVRSARRTIFALRQHLGV